MKNYMPLNGLRWSRDSGSANCDMLQSDVLGRPGGGDEGSDGAAAWDFNQKLHQYKLKE